MTLSVGDVVECRLGDAFCYAKLVFVHPTYQEIIALDPTRYEQPVSAPDALNCAQVRIFPLSKHLDDLSGAVRSDLQSSDVDYRPEFKLAVRDNQGAPIYWWLWDGNSIERVDQCEKLAALPERRLDGLQDIIAFWSDD